MLAYARPKARLLVLTPLTHRLAVPPLPQGGEGRRIHGFGAAFMTASSAFVEGLRIFSESQVPNP